MMHSATFNCAADLAGPISATSRSSSATSVPHCTKQEAHEQTNRSQLDTFEVLGCSRQRCERRATRGRKCCSTAGVLLEKKNFQHLASRWQEGIIVGRAPQWHQIWLLWGDFQRLEVKVTRKFSVHSRRRPKNVKRRRAVSHAALRDDSGHGWESGVKAITSWVAPLSDPWPSSHCALSVFLLQR